MKKYLLLALIALVAAACSKEEEDKSLEPANAWAYRRNDKRGKGRVSRIQAFF